MSGLDELIARLEKATGPDRELDWLIHSTSKQPWMAGAQWRASMFVDIDGSRCDPLDVDWSTDGLKWFQDHMPAYTSSIDAALTLVPEGFAWRLDCWRSVTARVFMPEKKYAQALRHDGNSALALCIAALKARAPNLPEGEK